MFSKRLLPALASRGERKLLYKFFDAIFKRNEKQCSSIIRIAFDYLFEHASNKLVIHELDLHEDPAERWLNTTVGPCEDFVAFVDHGLTIGATEHSMKLLEAMYDSLAATLPLWDIAKTSERGLINNFLRPLALVLERHKPPASSYVRGIFEILIRHGMLPRRPERPSKQPGPAYKTRRCDLTECADCDLLNDFLANEDEKVWQFTAERSRVTHIKPLVTDWHLFKLKEALLDNGDYSLTVEKDGTDFTKELEAYKSSVARSREHLRELKGSYMRDLLEDECYRELILLEPIAAEDPSLTAAGKKREADELIGESEKKHRAY